MNGRPFESFVTALSSGMHFASCFERTTCLSSTSLRQANGLPIARGELLARPTRMRGYQQTVAATSRHLQEAFKRSQALQDPRRVHWLYG